LPPPASPELPANYVAQKAVWLEIDWVMNAHTDAEIQALANELKAHQVTYVYAYTSYLKPGDFFNPTFEYAKKFASRFHAYAPDIRLLAWIGIPINVTTPDGEVVDNRLTNPAIREQVAAFSRQAVVEFGFDGVHINAEPVSDNDEAFITLLQEIRGQLPAGAALSVTAHALYPTERVTISPYPQMRYQSSVEYLKQIADNSDQIALMAYDSGLFLPSDYRAWMAYQVRESAEALQDTDTQLFIGIPTSEEWTLFHNITVEYLTNALYGVSSGISQTADYASVTGIAIYPYWETTNDQWAVIDAFP
jgi:hypothetical protein